jgi:hypothetical protein
MADLTVTFTLASTTPVNGYRLHYRPRNSTIPYTIHPNNFNASPAVVPGVVPQDYEGFLEADCSEGRYSTAANFLTNSFDCPEIDDFMVTTGPAFIEVSSPVVFSLVPHSNQAVKFNCIHTTGGANQVVGTVDAVIAPDGTVLSPASIRFDGVVDGDSYTIQSTMQCNATTHTVDIVANAGAQRMWVANTFACEQDKVFTLANQYTGFSSPAALIYDQASGRMYVGDYDDPSGNAYYFDPNTITGIANITRITGEAPQLYYTIKTDPIYRRIYFIGKSSGGLKVLSLDTNLWSLVPYGVDGVNFNRVSLTVTESKIIAVDAGQGTLTTIDRATLAHISTVNISSIPNSGNFTACRIFQVGNEMWVCSEFRSNGNIAVYNIGFTTQITTIILTGVAYEGSSRYRQAQYYNADTDRFYVSDAGSSKIFEVIASTKVVNNIITLTNREGKVYGVGNWIDDPITNDLYFSYSGYNSASDSQVIYRSYKQNRATFQFEEMYKGDSFSTLVQQTGTNKIWGAFAGNTFTSQLTGYLTDGKILKYNR